MIIIMYCNNNFVVKYWNVVCLELSVSPGDTDYAGTRITEGPLYLVFAAFASGRICLLTSVEEYAFFFYFSASCY